MSECRSISSLDDTTEKPDDDESEPALADARMAQPMAGGLNWLATRTRPDLAFYVIQIASAATRAPLRALALGKRCLRYLAGARDHGLALRSTHRLRGGGDASSSGVDSARPINLEGLGDASYED